MAGPLNGIRVVDLTTVISGPYATQILGDMGAEVIKVEAPGGDIMRAAGPSRSPDMGAAFLNSNRNKKSVVLNLKDREHRSELEALVRTADVFIHNMRMTAAERLGLTYPELQALSPNLVYCSIVGYGQSGPYRDRPAYDDVVQAGAGWADLERRVRGEPAYAPTIVADKTTALFAVSAINAALFHRARTGQGQSIEVPMYELLASFLLVEHLAGQTFRPALGPPGYSRLLSPHRHPYRTKDGYISVMPYTGAHWRAFFNAAGRREWAEDTRLQSNADRIAIIDLLYERLTICLAELTTSEWMALLLPLDVPCSPVNSIEDLLQDEHLHAVGLFKTVAHPTEGSILSVQTPLRFSATPCTADAFAPSLSDKARATSESA
ncbi:crotonobetainyl-CoA:carnitine CoA-transferase CaiB-like acyl-CoA transferase [Nitrobacteraceae bacterium AZCC 1564]